MAEIDSLQIEITTRAKQVDDTIDVLVKKLDLLSGSLKNINKINTSGLKKVANNFNNINKTTSSMDSGLSRVNTSAQKTTKSFGGLASSIGKFYATWFFVIRGIKSLGRSIEASADYVEAFNYYTVSFGKVASKWDKDWSTYGDENAKNYSNAFVTELNSTFEKLSGVSFNPKTGLLSETGLKNLGLNLRSVTEYAAQLGSMMDSVGHSGQTTLAATQAFVKLAADMSSLRNIDYTTAGSKIRSVLQGQSRAGYEFGWDTTMASLQAMADRLDLSKAVSEMTQMEKQQLRILVILEQSRVAWGDQANTINTFANQTRILRNNMSELSMMLGQLFVPILSKIMPVVNGITIALKNLISSIAGFFGLEIKDTGFGFSGIEEDVDGTTDSLDQATESAKKLRKQLQGFDKLNVITTPTDSGASTSGGVGGGIDLTDKILEATAEYEKVWQEAFDRMENQAEVFAKKVEKALAPVKSLFQNIAIGDWFAVGQDVTNIVVGITDFFTRAIENVDWEQIGENIGLFIKGIDFTAILSSVGQLIWEAINASIDQWKGMFDVAPIETTIITGILLIPFISKIANTFTTVLIPTFTNVVTFGSNVVGAFELIKNAGMTLHTALTTIFGTFATNFAGIVTILAGAGLAVTSFVSMFTDGFNWIKEALMIVGIALTAVGAIILGAPALITGVIAGIVAVVATLVIVIKDNWDAIVEWTSNLFDKVSTFFTDLWENVKGVWSIVSTWFSENVIEPIVLFFVGFAKRVGQVFEGLWIIVQAIWKIVSTWFNENVVQPIVNFFAPIVEKISSFFVELWEDIKFVWRTVSNWFSKNIIDPVSNTFKTACDKIGGFFSSLWSGIKSGVVSAMNGVIGGIESGINFIVNGINKIIKGFNKIVSWAAKVAEVDWGGVDLVPKVNLSRIKGYETGGFPEDGWFRATKGEYFGKFDDGTSYIGTNRQIENGVASGVYGAVRDANSEQNALLREQNALLRQILAKDTGISTRDIFNAVRTENREYINRNGESAFAF